MVDLNKVKVGTSGYYFLDWIGPFYPQDIQKGKMLDYYVKHFDVVEVNSSFYRIPHPKIFENMEKKTPEHFEFMVKGYRGFTHDRSDLISISKEFRSSLEPLVETHKLCGILLQFPYSFKHSPRGLAHLTRVLDLLEGFPLYVEFRHRSWYKDEVFDLFARRGTRMCSVDGPQISAMPRPELISVSKGIYVRLHGRNAEQWWKGGALRYDYLYTEAQLEDWISKIRECAKPIQSVYMFLNNCHRGQAIQNARMMKELLRRETGDRGAE